MATTHTQLAQLGASSNAYLTKLATIATCAPNLPLVAQQATALLRGTITAAQYSIGTASTLTKSTPAHRIAHAYNAIQQNLTNVQMAQCLFANAVIAQ